MAQEIDEGIAYLRALARPVAAPGATAAVTPWETSAAEPAGAIVDSGFGANGRYQGAEKRLSPRYKCEGSAEIQEDGREVRTWATFSDVSLHGCYVEAQATYPVGTDLHLKLEANGVRVECEASVRVTYPYLAMGIVFLEMSEENRARLKELLGTISRQAAFTPPAIIDPATADPHLLEPELVPSRAALGPVNGAVPDPAAAIRAVLAYFETHPTLLREDFLKLVAKSQVATVTS